MMNIADLLKEEKKHRLAQKWWMFSGPVTNDKGEELHVEIKSHGFYNQILRINGDGINYCSGHTIEKVKAMHEHLRTVLNNWVPIKQRA